MAQKRGPETPPPDPELTVPREEADQKLADRISKGRTLLQRELHIGEGGSNWRDDLNKWDDYNNELLTRLFTTPKFAKEYSSWGPVVMRMHPPTPAEQLADLKKRIADKLTRLESIKERLQLIPLAADVRDAPTRTVRTHTNRVFIVHGHDEAARETVARFLERLGVEAVILHEKATAGRTLIEKLEHYSDVDFAVILLTPDDLGQGKKVPSDLQPRARQNVILELGYFAGKLGRTNVCALYQGPLDLPTDYVGVGYVSLDEAGGWRLKLAKELRTAGFNIDMNLAL